MYKQILRQKSKRKLSQNLIGKQAYDKFVSKEGGKAIVSGFSYKNG